MSASPQVQNQQSQGLKSETMSQNKSSLQLFMSDISFVTVMKFD
jgi:hypothetical protein